MNRQYYNAQLLKKKPYRGDNNSIKFIGVESTYNLLSLSTTCNKPNGTIDGDLLIAFVHTINSTTFCTQPSEWFMFTGYDYLGHRLRVYWKPASSELTSYNFTFQESAENRITICSYRNVNITTPQLGFVIKGSSTGNGNNSVVYTRKNAMLVFSTHKNNNDIVNWIRPQGFVKVYDSDSSLSCTVSNKLLKNNNDNINIISTPSISTGSNICFSLTLNPKYP